jgi:drug/metabolite transporter (DMT)-like permease
VTTPSRAQQRLNITTFIAIALIGGGNPVGVAIAVDELAPIWAAAARFLAAGAIFALVMVLFRVPIPRGRALVGGLIYGVIGFFGAFTFLFIGLQDTPPGTSQVIIALVPLITLLLAVAHGLERFSLRAFVGAFIALAGLSFLVADRLSADVPLVSMIAVLAGAALLAESGVVIKLTPRSHPAASNAVGMLSGGAMLLALSAAIGEPWATPTQADTWSAMIFLVLGGSVAVFSLFVFLLGRWDVSAVSYTLLLQPLATIAYSAILTHEPITPALFAGAAIILVGVYVGAFSSGRATPEAEAPPSAA